MPDESPDTTEAPPATLLAVPNVSVGGDASLVPVLLEAFTSPERVSSIASPHYDRDHGRAVFTLAGPPGALVDALVAGARAAIARIDLAVHAGGHPFIGVLDVAPIVYLDDSCRGLAWVQALVLADRLGHDVGLPVFLYGELGDGRTRAELRRRGAPRLLDDVQAGKLSPDFGPARISAANGATLVTARRPLVAFNLELEAPATAKDAAAVAALIREGGDRGLPGVRAIGLALGERGGAAQVSVNVEDPVAVPLARLVEAVGELAPVAMTELVGLAPRAAFDGFPENLECRNRATLEDALGF